MGYILVINFPCIAYILSLCKSSIFFHLFINMFKRYTGLFFLWKEKVYTSFRPWSCSKNWNDAVLWSVMGLFSIKCRINKNILHYMKSHITFSIGWRGAKDELWHSVQFYATTRISWIIDNNGDSSEKFFSCWTWDLVH